MWYATWTISVESTADYSVAYLSNAFLNVLESTSFTAAILAAATGATVDTSSISVVAKIRNPTSKPTSMPTHFPMKHKKRTVEESNNLALGLGIGLGSGGGLILIIVVASLVLKKKKTIDTSSDASLEVKGASTLLIYNSDVSKKSTVQATLKTKAEAYGELTSETMRIRALFIRSCAVLITFKVFGVTREISAAK
jgi:hypothetical protein